MQVEARKLWSAPAFYIDSTDNSDNANSNHPTDSSDNTNANSNHPTATKKDFRDSDFHRFLDKNNIPRSRNLGTEWFYFGGYPEMKSKQLFDEFRQKGFTALQSGKEKTPYILRPEQEEAVSQALTYFDSHEKGEFLWNAKPRFGKTLATYDLAKRLEAQKVLIVTNRPAIANSWFDDFDKFIDGYYFISETDSLKARKTISREQYLALEYSLRKPHFTFLSLQDLKDSKYFGGEREKHDWIAGLEWDLLIIDEAHEGVDTSRTDDAFQFIKRRNTLHLSGTPFKAIANNKFPQEAIYNWTYLDEQRVKQEEIDANELGPHTDMPDIRLYTYRISEMTSDIINEGVEIDGESRDYAFDLNEFFATQNQKFIHEDDVRAFLKNLSTNEKYPFSTPELRDELRHTFWYVGNRVDSVKALEQLLQQDPVFGEYKIIVAAGNGQTFAEEEQNFQNNEKSFDKVRKAIAKYPKTITLSCGQLTTGVTIPEWSAVLMLTDIKSPSTYMQAAFRAQNPYRFTESEETRIKESAYLFDFAPTRVLEIYDNFANGLSLEAMSGTRTEEERKENIRELLNYFPVISEDTEGRMVELDAEKVLTFPNALVATEIVKARFMTNLLFNDHVKNVFHFPKVVEDIFNKMDVEKNKRVQKSTKVLDLDDARKTEQNKQTKINENSDVIFGQKIYKNNIERVVDEALQTAAPDELLDFLPGKLTSEVTEPLIAKYKQVYKATNKETDEIKEKIGEKITMAVAEYELAEVKDPEALKEKLTAVTEDLVVENVAAKEEAKVQEVQKSKEDEVREHLRAFTRTIPMFIMANSSRETITIDNFDEEISDEDFLDLTNITKDEFHMLRDGFDYEENGERKTFPGVFDKYRFNASIAEFVSAKKKKSDYFKAEEDIFELIPNQKNNQIFTPKNVVQMMIDGLEKESPELFRRTDSTFIDLYMKSGLYITEIVKRLFNNTRGEYESDDECLKHILENQVYGLAPTKILFDITTGFIFGFDIEHKISLKNFKQHDLIADAKAGTTVETLARLYNGKMKFDAVVGNPPYHYEAGRRKIPIYQNFIMTGTNSVFANYAVFIVPDGWVKGGQQLEPLREYLVQTKHLKSVRFYKNSIFPNVAVDASIMLFDNNNRYDEVEKIIFHETGEVENGTLDYQYRDVIVDDAKYKILDIYKRIIKSLQDADSRTQLYIMTDAIPGWAPFGLNTKCFRSNEDKFLDEKDARHNVRVLVGEKKRDFYWINPNDDFSYDGSDGRIEFVNLKNAEKWKMVFPKAGHVDKKQLPTRILEPGEIFIDKYLCVFADSEKEARNIEKYFNSRFYRAGLYSKVTSWNLYRNWHSNIPL